MANQIRMTPDSMRARAAEYSAEGQKLQEIISKMNNLLTQLQSEWEGAAKLLNGRNKLQMFCHIFLNGIHQ